MIDTIRLRVNHIDKYPKIYEQYYAAQRKKGTITQAYVEESTGEMLQSSFLASYIFHDTDRVLPTMHRSSVYIASSDYSISFIINPAGNYLQFDFSIPKSIYGTNVIQFVNLYDQSSHVSFLELMNFLNRFLKEELIHTPLLEDVEIFQIDLCYNQFFNSKNDALQYLDEQKNLLVRYARSSNNRCRTYDTSFMYVTSRYSFKVYHKGTEFRRNDYKHLTKSNPMDLPLQYLLEQSDNILRYEMSFRRPMLNYLFHYHLNVSKGESGSTFYSDHPYARYCRHLARIDGKSYQAYIAKYRSFCLQSVFDKPVSALTGVFDDTCVTFDQTVFDFLYNAFWQKVNQYQLTQICSIQSVVDRIAAHNIDVGLLNQLRRKKESPLMSYRMISAALLVMKGFKVNDFKGLIPRRTLYRLKADLKKIGISDKHTDINMPMPRIDYFDYKIFFKQFH